MYKGIRLFVGFLFLYITAFAQTSNEKMLFVIDSIPLLQDPEEWNQLMQEDIADATVLRNKDTLKSLGLGNFDGVTYIFTKEYRNRADSLKKIPSLKQMDMKNEAWNLNNIPYCGKYIDYYNNGKIQNEGTLFYGKLNGELTIYFKNGIKKSVANYKDGLLNGVSNNYYKNGALKQTRNFINGKPSGELKMYFVNGQIESEKKWRKETNYDTAISYYSTGKIKYQKLIKNGAVPFNKKVNDLNYYTHMFNQSLNGGDIKEANKSFFKILQMDSISSDTYFKKGMLMLKEFRFDKAIAAFDEALKIEPLMRESLLHRALARIKKYQFLKAQVSAKDNNGAVVSTKDNISMPIEELEKICHDLQQAQYVDFSEDYISKIIPEVFLFKCT